MLLVAGNAHFCYNEALCYFNRDWSSSTGPMAQKRNKKNRPAGRRREAGAARPAAPLFSRSTILCLVLFLFSILLYANTFDNDFVWDDRDLIVENPTIDTFDLSTIKTAFIENFWETKDRLGGYYRPLITLSYHCNHLFSGMNPAGFHAANVIVNALAVVVLFLLVLVLFGNRLLALLTALIFAALPLHTENIAWIAGRTDIFATFWMLLSLLLFAIARRRGSWSVMLFSLAACLLALFSKEIALLVPVLALVVARVDGASAPSRRATDSNVRSPGETHATRRMATVLLFMIPLAVYLVLRAAAIGTGTTTYTHLARGALDQVLLAFSIIAGYALKLVYPFRLSAEYDAPVPAGPADPHAVAGMLLAAIVIYAAVRFRRRGELLFGISLMILGVVPVLNIVPLGEISAERFLYFPSIGFALVVAFLFANMLDRHPGVRRYFRNPAARTAPRPLSTREAALVILILLALLGAYGTRTVARNRDWRNEETLFTATVASTPGSARAHLNLGNVYWRAKRAGDAVAQYQRALDIDPDYVEALSNLAGVYQSQKKIDAAVPLLERAIKQAPGNAELLNNLGILYLQKNRYADARQLLEQALEANPRHLRAHYNLGLACLMQNDLAAALPQFERVKNAGDDFSMANYYIGLISIRMGNKEYAKQHLERYMQSGHHNVRYRQRASAMLKQIEQADTTE